MRNFLDPFESREITSLAGFAVTLALFTGAGAITKGLPRDTADSLYWLVASLILLGTVVLSATFFSVALRRRSNRFVVATFAVFAVIAVAFLPTYLDDQDEPVIFSPGLFTVLGMIACAGLAVVLAARLVCSGAARARAVRARRHAEDSAGD